MSHLEFDRGEASLVDGRRPYAPNLRIPSEVIRFTCVSLDIMAIVASIVVSTAVYERSTTSAYYETASSAKLAVLVALFFVAIFALQGGYRLHMLCGARNQIFKVLKTWAITFFVLSVIAFLLKVSADFSRGSVLMGFIVGLVSLIVCHAAIANRLRVQFNDRSLSVSRVFVVASGDLASGEKIVRKLGATGVEVVGVSIMTFRGSSRVEFSRACVSANRQLKHVLSRSAVDAVYLFTPWGDMRAIEELRAAMTPVPVPIFLFPDESVSRVLLRSRIGVADLQGYEIERPALSRWECGAKRTADIVIATTALLMLSPLLLYGAIGVILDSGRPILFRQQRKGFGGRPFTILKFRTMTVQENGPVVQQAKKNDSRVTRFGAILRRTSIDELPQLLNVLKGQMSIVGPRPHAIAHDDHYSEIIAPYALRNHVKPGITGWAQVNGLRGETHEVGMMEARIARDLWYINNWSIALDLRIVFLTAVQLLLRASAY